MKPSKRLQHLFHLQHGTQDAADASGLIIALAARLHIHVSSAMALCYKFGMGDARLCVRWRISERSISLTLSSANSSLPFSRTYDTLANGVGHFSFQLDGTYAADPQGRNGPRYSP